MLNSRAFIDLRLHRARLQEACSHGVSHSTSVSGQVPISPALVLEGFRVVLVLLSSMAVSGNGSDCTVRTRLSNRPGSDWVFSKKYRQQAQQ
jgi:hypothetical protein